MVVIRMLHTVGKKEWTRPSRRWGKSQDGNDAGRCAWPEGPPLLPSTSSSCTRMTRREGPVPHSVSLREGREHNQGSSSMLLCRGTWRGCRDLRRGRRESVEGKRVLPNNHLHATSKNPTHSSSPLACSPQRNCQLNDSPRERVNSSTTHPPPACFPRLRAFESLLDPCSPEPDVEISTLRRLAARGQY